MGAEMALRLVAFLLAAALVVAGVALGAATQKEEFLEPVKTGDPSGQAGNAAGNLVLLTAVVVAVGATAGALLLARRAAPDGGLRLARTRRSWRERVRPVRSVADPESWRRAGRRLAGPGAWRRHGLPVACVLGLLLGMYVLVVLMQTQFILNHALVGSRQAVLSVNPILHNAEANGLVLLPAFALVAAALSAVGAAAPRVLGARRRLGSAAALHRRQVAAAALAAPMLAVACAGSVRMLVDLPPDAELAGYLVVLPLAAVASLGLLAVAGVKAWYSGAAAGNSHMAPVAAEAWRGANRAELALLGAFGVLAIFGSFLPERQLPSLILSLGTGATSRAMVQMLPLLALPLLPSLALHRCGQRLLDQAEPAHRLHEGGTPPSGVLALVALGAALAGALVTVWSLPGLGGALWVWLLAGLPMLLLLPYADRFHGAGPLLLLAATLWGIGNTVTAVYDGRATEELIHGTSPGILALWRLAAAVLLGLAGVRMAQVAAGPVRASVLWPLSVAVGFAFATILLLELPVTVWVQGSAEVDAVGVGSLVASQTGVVRFIMHSVSFAAAVLGALALARLRRPDWFRRRRGPSQEPAGEPAPSPA